MSQEYLDIVDENNNHINEQKTRQESHIYGFWHRTVHVYFFRINNNEIEFLIHLRAKTKDLSPNVWDTRFGGHLKAGESIGDGISNEIKEEVGIEINQNKLIIGEVYKKNKFPNCEFASTFYYEFNQDISTLHFSDGEVQSVKWQKSSECISSMKNRPEIWSGCKTDFNEILNVLKNKLSI